MPDLVVIVPSRGRPAAAHELRDAFNATCSLDTQLIFAIDKRDSASIHDYPHDGRATTWWSESSTMVEALNMRSAALLAGDMAPGAAAPFAIGFMGDDHRPRTVGWDRAYVEALRDLKTGMVYGDDLLQHATLPTQIAMTADIVKALGWMAPPALIHMYVDNWWLELGQRAGCIRYLPDVVVEHVHPAAGKAEWDEGHVRVNQPAMYHRDQAAFARLRVLQMPAAVAELKALRGER